MSQETEPWPLVRTMWRQRQLYSSNEARLLLSPEVSQSLPPHGFSAKAAPNVGPMRPGKWSHEPQRRNAQFSQRVTVTCAILETNKSIWTAGNTGSVFNKEPALKAEALNGG